jgi:hypothetical protein
MITLRKAEERGQGSGELAFRYLMDCVTLLLVGPGRFPVGNTMFGKSGLTRSK